MGEEIGIGVIIGLILLTGAMYKLGYMLGKKWKWLLATPLIFAMTTLYALDKAGIALERECQGPQPGYFCGTRESGLWFIAAFVLVIAVLHTVTLGIGSAWLGSRNKAKAKP